MAFEMSFKIRKFHNRSTVLILIWNFAVYFSIYALFKSFNVCALAICFGGCVISGWLADVYIGRYRCIRYSSRIAWVGSITVNTYYLVQNYLWQPHHTVDIVTKIILNGVLGVGLAGLFVNSITFGVDQLVDASSTNISSYISWYSWLYFLASSVTTLSRDCFSQFYQQLLPLSLLFVMTLLVVTDCCFNHLLIKEPVTQNPLKLIFQVLRYAVKNKYPRLRSAFTYWEDKPYSRIDLGKTKYGGPFTTEQVEDVKTFFQILFILAAAVTLMVFIYGHDTSDLWLIYHYRDHYFIKNYTLTLEYMSNCIERSIVKAFSNFAIVVYVPVFELILYPLLKKCMHYENIGIFLRVQISIGMSMLSEAIYLSFEIANKFQIDKAQNYTCSFYSSSEDVTNDNVLHLDYKWLILPQGILGVSLYIYSTSGSEFIISQTPYSMRGLLIGWLSFLYGSIYALVFYCYKAALYLLRKYIQNNLACSLWYFVASFALCILIFLLSIITKKCYRLRRRDDDLHNQQIFAVNYYDKYLAPMSNSETRVLHNE